MQDETPSSNIPRRIKLVWTGALALLVTLQAATLSSFGEGDCEADKAWLHPTGPPDLTMTPEPHPKGEDCPFYQAAWRTFLSVTNPDGGVPAFVSSFATIDSTFGKEAKMRFASWKPGKLALLPRVAKHPGHQSINAGVAQAGDLAGILIDRDGYPVYYAIHMNDVFTKFLRDNKLVTPAGAQAADPNLRFPTGAIELKSAWKIVPPGANLDDKYFTVEAQVPRLKKRNGTDPDVVIDRNAPAVDVRAALVAIHVVFVLGNHSEFIWSTFEHTDDNGNPDSAPLGPIPGTKPPTTEVSGTDFLLFKAHTTIVDGNNASSGAERAAKFDEATQRFAGTGAKIPSSIYRFYPFSKVIARDETTHQPKPADEMDEQVVAINKHIADLFKEDAANGVTDKRRFYRLVGAVWLDKHEDFLIGKAFKNGSTQTSDEGPVAGEDGLSSTTMESFTQEDNANCFSCHDTQAITSRGKRIIEPKLINVSHIISKYLIENP
jgi:hypothetical protein